MLEVERVSLFRVKYNTKGQIRTDVGYTYYKGERIVEIDDKTFKRIDSWFAIDKNHVLCEGWKRESDSTGVPKEHKGVKIFESNHSENLHQITCADGEKKEYYTDGEKLYASGCYPIDDFDLASMDPLCGLYLGKRAHLIKDKDSYVYSGIKITEAQYKKLHTWQEDDVIVPLNKQLLEETRFKE